MPWAMFVPRAPRPRPRVLVELRRRQPVPLLHARHHFTHSFRRERVVRGAPPQRSAAEAFTNGPARAARYLGPLPRAKWRLDDVETKLKAGGYKLLLRTAWSQSAASWGSRSGLALETLGIDVPGLSGNFLLERGSLLHFGMNLRYAAEANAIPQQLNEIRRVKFAEKQYYDHPTLGVIAIVTPGGK